MKKVTAEQIAEAIQEAAPYASTPPAGEHPHCIWCGVELPDPEKRRDLQGGMARCADDNDSQRACIRREYGDKK